jgi:hypothetical protein
VRGRGARQHPPAGAEALADHEVEEAVGLGGAQLGRFGARDPVGHAPEHAEQVAVALLEVLALGDRDRVVVEGGEGIGGRVGATSATL